MKNIISTKNLSKTYSFHKKEPGLKGSIKSLFKRKKLYNHAVKKVNLEVKEGELVGFLGPNGAGKTTTLKMLSGILYPSEGEAKVLGHTPWDRKPEFQKQFALVMGQKNQLWWDLPAMESFILNKEIYEVPDDEFKKTLDELTELLDIKDILNVQVRKLSLGQRMKCELVAALLHKPKILFLDEPTIGLDVVSQQKIREFIKEHNTKYKTTILLTSHYMEDVVALAKRLIIIDKGEIIYDGTMKDLMDKYVDEKILEITFTEVMTKDTFKGMGKIKEFSKKRVVLQVPIAEHKKIAAKILQDLPVDDILINEKSIDDIIRDIFTQTK